MVADIIEYAKTELGIEYIWCWYEPYAEITWLTENEEASHTLLDYAKKSTRYMHDLKYYTQESAGNFAEWYAKSEQEWEFGAKRYSLCAEFVDLYHQHKQAVDTGKGLNKQVERTIHALCNPLGLGYWEEAKICFSRGLIAALFCVFSFERAIWIYRNIFRCKY